MGGSDSAAGTKKPKSHREKIETYRQKHHGHFTMNFMEAGGCLEEFMEAGLTCKEAGANGRGEVEDACVRATVALRRCMVANETFFRHYIRTMDEGIEENERIGYGKRTSEDGKWRWWNSMRTCSSGSDYI